jgi:chromosome segregation ATPase
MEEELFVADGELAVTEEQKTELERRLRKVEEEKAKMEQAVRDARRGQLIAVRRCQAVEAEYAAELSALRHSVWDPGKTTDHGGGQSKTWDPGKTKFRTEERVSLPQGGKGK